MRDLSKYRNEATKDGMLYDELIDYGYDNNKENLIPESSVVSVINDIESDVNEIQDLLDEISGLTEIEEIKGKVNELSEKLY